MFSAKVLCESVLTKDMRDRIENGLHLCPLSVKKAWYDLAKGEIDPMHSSNLLPSRCLRASCPDPTSPD